MEGVIGFVTMFAGNFAPKNWAFCQNQTISIASNTALFSILGTTYGGNGTTTFSLPDLRSRVPVGAGQGPGLSPYSLGQMGGGETFAIANANFPLHSHPLAGSITMPGNAADGNADTPQNNYPAKLTGTNMYSTVNDASALGNMQLAFTAATAGSGSPQPVNNIQPVMGMNFIICQFGVFPARN